MSCQAPHRVSRFDGVQFARPCVARALASGLRTRPRPEPEEPWFSLWVSGFHTELPEKVSSLHGSSLPARGEAHVRKPTCEGVYGGLTSSLPSPQTGCLPDGVSLCPSASPRGAAPDESGHEIRNFHNLNVKLFPKCLDQKNARFPVTVTLPQNVLVPSSRDPPRGPAFSSRCD